MKPMSKWRAFGRMGCIQPDKMKAPFWIVYMLLMFAMFQVVPSSVEGYSYISVPDFSFLGYIAVYFVSKSLSAPRYRELPMTYKRRAAYMLARLYIIVAAFAVLGIALNICTSELGKTFNPFDIIDDGIIITNIYMGVNGHLFSAFRYLFVPACGIILFRINDKRAWLGCVVFVLAYLVTVFIPVWVYNAAAADDMGFGYVQNVCFCLDNMPLGWLYAAVYGVITAAVVAFSAVIVIKGERPSEL